MPTTRWQSPAVDPLTGQPPFDPVGVVLRAAPNLLMQAAGRVAQPFVDSYGATDAGLHGQPYDPMAMVDLGGAVSGGGLLGTGDNAALGMGIRAYHGSPHHFDRFDMGNVGTGEGFQAFGHGLYFAEKEGVARNYRDSLSDASQDISIGGQPFDYSAAPEAEKRAFDRLYSKSEPYQADLPRAIDNTFADADRFTGPESLDHQAKMLERLAILNRWKEAGFQDTGGSKGAMYEVNIDAHPDDFMHWGNPLEDQPAAVQQFVRDSTKGHTVQGADLQVMDALRADPKWRGDWQEDRTWMHLKKLFPNISDDAGQAIADRVQSHIQLGTVPKGMSGQKVYERLADQVGGPAELSRQMAAAGIPGVRYLDGGSRGMGEGTHNYVVFDHDLIDIARKYGLAGALLGGAGLGGAVGNRLFRAADGTVVDANGVPQT